MIAADALRFLFDKRERFTFDFHYFYSYHYLSLSQSDVHDPPNEPIRFFKNREKVVIVVEEVKSEPLWYWNNNVTLGIFLK